MRTASQNLSIEGSEPILATAKRDSLIERIAGSDVPLPVIDPAGKLVGEIDREIIMRAMNSKS